ncbi:MAG TPA: prolipoprotein diacylglyceryl transferase, partial [Prolixibacteraceae bacterium]|nr:prolipoprotein diacylglyceryl transferase [Prolixibacteraceae bacterium]
MNVLTFQLPPPQNYFGLFYSISFLVALMILLYEGYKRNYPILPWILILTFSRILFVIGSKVFALSADEWRVMFENLAVVPASKKVLFGGLLLGGAGLMIGKWWLKFKPNFWDAFAVVLPLALAIQRVGCFFNGCCFGKPSSLPWAVQYPPYTLPHFFHHQEVLIGNEEFFSLPV